MKGKRIKLRTTINDTLNLLDMCSSCGKKLKTSGARPMTMASRPTSVRSSTNRPRVKIKIAKKGR